MRKLITLFCILTICENVDAQEANLFAQGMYTAKKQITDNDWYMISRYTRLVKKHPKSGYFVEISTDANTGGFSAGYVFSNISKKDFWFELTAGPEYDQAVWSNETTLGALATISFSNKASEDRAQWKLQGFCSYYYSKEDKWHQMYATVSIFKWLNVGILDQTYSVHLAPMIQLTLPHSIMQPFVAFDGNQTAIGINYNGVFIKK